MWRFNFIPEELRERVVELYRAGEWLELMKIYNQYRVSPDILTSCCARDLVMQWTEYAIEQRWLG